MALVTEMPRPSTALYGPEIYAAPCCEVAPGAPASSMFPPIVTDQPNSSPFAPSDATTLALKCDVDFQPVDGLTNE